MQFKQYLFTALATAVVFATTALAAAMPVPTFTDQPCPQPPRRCHPGWSSLLTQDAHFAEKMHQNDPNVADSTKRLAVSLRNPEWREGSESMFTYSRSQFLLPESDRERNSLPPPPPGAELVVQDLLDRINSAAIRSPLHMDRYSAAVVERT
ncbi:hypothetical protein SISNIDRAFT_538863 [Sistotremastrum niveocremeum HHB9708]|uniref:Uncharacterized protein n=1 Tax=Sistotremastrum niveocremeum HHB9708 TaxID=1314777 RepID=A0A164X990_9AGAM|nr:hypothetical protein SISNIDRAFT_538863 [Sistotremastrum niveocremeum HHB9708]